jgi:polyribonucleotide nucleotidyltransferase
MQKKNFSCEIGGKTLTATFSDLTEQANGSVIVSYGKTIVLATAVISKNKRENVDFFPLTVDYEERFYAAGQILGSRFVRREGKPSDEAILSGRIIDRTIRPLFDDHIRNEIQVIITVLSIDKDDPDILAINAASLALATSDIPWNGPVSAIRLTKHSKADAPEINPDYDFRRHDDAELELVICGRNGKINMIEASGKEMPEAIIADALEQALPELKKLEDFQEKIIKEIGKKKITIEKEEISDDAKNTFTEKIESRFREILKGGAGGEVISEILDSWMSLFTEQFPDEKTSLALAHFESAVDKFIHKEAVGNNTRPDGRGFKEVRALFAQAGGISPILHGTGIFYRGGTHVLSALTLAGPGESQTIDGIEIKTEKRYMHHYNFPPFSSGEIKKVGNTNRREIGHGALAEKALLAVLPSQDEFPYTIRIVSESMASNGSTSMASVCGSTLALMDGGVPIKRPVAGIAMGVMMEDEKNYKILTDIQGPEDHYGDMDFKVAGTEVGITAVQMDIKVGGIPLSILKEALADARDARLKILAKIKEAIPAPRPMLSSSAPKVLRHKVKEDQIGLVIGPGGKMINGIKATTGAEHIDIDEQGGILIVGKNGSAEAALEKIKELTKEYKVGEKFTGTVARIMDFGAFVEIGPRTDGLVHVSQIAPFRINRITDALSVGEKVEVIIKEIDEKHRINLSIKDVDPDFAARKGLKPDAPINPSGTL